MLAMIEDIRVILVKLSDRLHNMETLGAMPSVKKKRIARETLDIYAPIANRLGINRLKVQLEDLGFKHLHPFRYRVLENALSKSKGSQKQIVKRISDQFAKAMEEDGIKGEIIGREKHLYSIYKKMAEKKRALSDVVDVYGFRIIVDEVSTEWIRKILRSAGITLSRSRVPVVAKTPAARPTTPARRCSTCSSWPAPRSNHTASVPPTSTPATWAGITVISSDEGYAALPPGTYAPIRRSGDQRRATITPGAVSISWSCGFWGS